MKLKLSLLMIVFLQCLFVGWCIANMLSGYGFVYNFIHGTLIAAYMGLININLQEINNP